MLPGWFFEYRTIFVREAIVTPLEFDDLVIWLG
jgi:hypothetical protein